MIFAKENRTMTNRTFSMNESLTFGKHKGKTVLAVYKEEITYLRWCFENISKFCITDMEELLKVKDISYSNGFGPMLVVEKNVTNPSRKKHYSINEFVDMNNERLQRYNTYQGDIYDGGAERALEEQYDREMYEKMYLFAMEGDLSNAWNID
jgi:hypothetical protein